MSGEKAPGEKKALASYSLLRLRLFPRVRWLLRTKAAKKPHKSPAPAEKVTDAEVGAAEEVVNTTGEGMGVGGDGGLSFGRGLALQRSVKMIHFGSWEEKEEAAAELARLAAEGWNRRRLMADLGVIPPLVAMVGSEVAARRWLAVRALIELANGSHTNKALMVEAGILSKLPNDVNTLDEPSKKEFAHLLSLLSSLANGGNFSLDSSKIIPPLVSILESTSCIDTKKACLTVLHNLSSVLNNTEILISNGVIDHLLNLSSTRETCEKALAVLGNLVVTIAGKRSIEKNPTVPDRFIEITTWEDNPKCQESSAYILMVLAHQSPLQRQRMAEAGIVQVLLGLALLGSPLAKKRALKILQWFKDERQIRVGLHSGPQVGRRATIEPALKDRRRGEEGKVLMREIVKESLYKNLEKIMSRARNGDEGALKLKDLVVCSSSKSLPY